MGGVESGESRVVSLLRRATAEDGGADTDQGGTFGDGGFEIVGHAHG